MKYLKLTVLTFAFLILAAIPAFALEEATPQVAPGIGWLFLIIGIGAIVLIGFVLYGREGGGGIEGEARPKE